MRYIQQETKSVLTKMGDENSKNDSLKAGEIKSMSITLAFNSVAYRC